MRDVFQILGLCGSILLFGCSSIPPTPPTTIKPVTQLEPIKATTSSEPIFFSSIERGFPDQPIGQHTRGISCERGRELFWQPAGDKTAFNEFKDLVRVKLKEYGYNLTSEPFTDKTSKDGGILIRARIIDMKANICYSAKGVKGEVYVQVEWEIYSKRADTHLQVKTEGVGTAAEFDPIGLDHVLFIRAVSMATINMIATRDVFRMLNAGE